MDSRCSARGGFERGSDKRKCEEAIEIDYLIEVSVSIRTVGACRIHPSKEEPLFFTDFNYRETALDKSEPKVGNRYILGYTLDYGVEKYVFVPGVVDLQDPS